MCNIIEIMGEESDLVYLYIKEILYIKYLIV